MDRALSEFEIQGIPTNIDIQRQIVNHKIFQSGKFGTGILQTILQEE